MGTERKIEALKEATERKRQEALDKTNVTAHRNRIVLLKIKQALQEGRIERFERTAHSSSKTYLTQ